MSSLTERNLGAIEIISPIEYLDYCRGLRSQFENPPQVKLELISQAVPGNQAVGAVDVAATTAVQCYAPGVAAMKPRPDSKSREIVRSTLDAGHNTTRLHVNYTWKLVGLSRSVTHDVFHSTPFYNSEQQSQRYVEAKAGNYLVPMGLTERQRELYLGAAHYTNEMYFQLLQNLHPEVERRLRQMYPIGGRIAQERLKSKTDKVCQEVARYVLPIGQLTIFDHTLSELQLLRLFRASRMANFSDEARYVIGEMVSKVAEVDPSILTELRMPLGRGPAGEIEEKYLSDQKKEFDQFLDGKQSRMKPITEGDREFLIRAVRNVLGVPEEQMSESEVFSALMDPQKNHLLADVYESGMFDPLTGSLRQLTLSFATKLSHTADSQRQRQRRTPGATPSISSLYDGTPDFITPLVIRENEGLSQEYQEIQRKIFENVEKCLEAGVPRESALLLLPNGLAVRVVEQGDLFDFFHRWKQRLCYTAQEEIFFISVEQVEQVLQSLPSADQMLLAPCGIRKAVGTKPKCPEANRWCGQPVFKFDINEYKEHRLI